MHRARSRMIRRRHWIGNHEEGEEQQRAIGELMFEDGPALPEVQNPQRQRADIARKETPTNIGTTRAGRDERSERDHPPGERDVLAPLTGRNPRSRQREHRKDDAEVGGIEKMLSSNADQRLRENCHRCRHRMNPQIIRPQQQREAESRDNGTTVRTRRVRSRREREILRRGRCRKGEDYLRD